MSNINRLLNVLASYYEQVKGILHTKYPEKDRRFSELMEKFETHRKALKQLGRDELWKRVAMLKKQDKYIQLLYNFLDFRVQEDTDFTSTRVDSIETHLRTLTHLFSLYNNEFKGMYKEAIEKAYKKHKTDSVEILQNQFHEQPNSIDLYIKCMRNNSDGSAVQAAVELDKSMVLGERKYISSWLTMGLKPQSEFKMDIPVPADSTQITLHRPVHDTFIFTLPEKSLINEGPMASNITSIVSKRMINPRPTRTWSIEIKDPGKPNTMIIEQFDRKNKRVLGSASDILLEKIDMKGFGRPGTYGKIMNKELNSNMSMHLSRLARKETIPYSLNINLLIANIKTRLREDIEKKSLEHLLIEGGGGFVEIIMREISKFNLKKSMNAIILKEIYDIQAKFYKELLSLYTRTTVTAKKQWFDKHSTLVLNGLLRARENIFNTIKQYTYYDQHIYNKVRIN